MHFKPGVKVAWKPLLKIALLPLMFLLYWISGCFRRSRRVWVFGANAGAFSDNAKHLFCWVTDNLPEICAVWISGNSQTLSMVRSGGGVASHRWSVAGILYTLRAKYYIYSSYPSDINYFCSNGAIFINLWHGVPIKKIEFDITHGPLRKIFHDVGPTARRFLYPHIYMRPSYVISPSPRASTIFARAFRIPLSNCIDCGYPRTDILYLGRDELADWSKKWMPSVAVSQIDAKATGEKKYLYLPTWRDNEDDFIEASGLLRDEFNSCLVRNNAILFVKLHPASKPRLTIGLERQSNIVIIDKGVDVTAVLPLVDVLITDYSSVFFDFCALNKPVYFFAFDLAQYKEDSRGFYEDYDELVPGPILSNASALMDIIDSGEDKGYLWKQGRVWNEFMSGSTPGSCNRVARFIRSLEE